MIQTLTTLIPTPYTTNESGLQWRFNNYSIILSDISGIYSNGIDTYEVMNPHGEIIGYASITTVNRLLIESQIPRESAIQRYPELYI